MWKGDCGINEAYGFVGFWWGVPRIERSIGPI